MTPAFVLFLSLQPLVATATATSMPTRFEADRVFVVPQTSSGQTLKLYTDSGGGLFIDERATQRLGLVAGPVPKTPAYSDMPPNAKLVKLPPFKHGHAIPAPLENGGNLMVMPAEEADKNRFGGDGMLGEAWFGGRVWTWDYPGEHLILEGADWKPSNASTRVALGFKADAAGKRETNFPRLTIRIDGNPLDVLLDTGATTTLTPEALTTVADRLPAERATSMIVDTQFQAWRKAHPDWRVIENAQYRSHAAMIEVPAVEIAGAIVGPVWFTSRPDKNFHAFMSGMMDGQVEGALGGNALSHFVMTLDYPGAVAWFRCTRDCRSTPQSAP